MPLIKLNRINKGGEILINSEHIVYMETEGRSTTVHLTDKSLFAVEDSLDAIVQRIEEVETARIARGIRQSGVAGGASSGP